MKINFISLMLLLIVLTACSTKEDDVNLKSVEPDPKPVGRNIIFMIGDGMGLTQVTAARTVLDNNMNILKCDKTGIQSTHSADEYVTDSGAATTAMACGQKTNHYTVGVDVNGNPLSSILEIAKNNGLSTGILTTSHIAHATPATFYAHSTDRFDYEGIAYQLIDKKIDFFMGGGRQYFDQRSDGLNLMDSLYNRGYEVVYDLTQISGTGKVAVLIAEGHPVKYSEGRGDVLPNSVEMALNRLKENKKGFFLIVEGAQIDWACEDNDQEYLIDEMLDFDRAVGKALDFAISDGNTLVVVTGDHETGGYTLVGGDEQANTVEGQFITYLHTGAMVPVFAYGPGADEFVGVYENTAFFFKFLDYYNFSK